MSLRAETIESGDASNPNPFDDGLSPDVFRQLFVSLDLQPDTQPVIGVTSAIRGEGRTTVAIGLAYTLANDLDTLISLVEVDLDNPSMAHRFNLDPALGLTTVLTGDKGLREVSTLIAPNLCVVPAGESAEGVPNLLRQLPAKDPFRDMRGLPRIVILDLPPLLNDAYSSVAAQVADVLVMVVRSGVTPVSAIGEALIRLDKHLPAGIVLNGSRSSLPSWWPGSRQ